MNYIYTINMKANKTFYYLTISLFIFMIISILSIYATKFFLRQEFNNLYIKQILFYIIGILLIIFTIYKGFDYLKKYHLLIYIGTNILLLSLLVFGININGSKCWLYIGPISFQPSEIMKISLIITLSSIISKFKKKKKKDIKEEFFLLLKLLIITIIPSILTFLEPDTGVVIIYLLIFITFIFFIKLNKIWYISFISFFSIIISSFLIIYFFKQDIFIKLFGYNIFYRLDRILNWFNMNGYQLKNSLIAIGSSGLYGFGYLKNNLYFPEPQTDFIFTTFVSNFGFTGGILLIITIIIFDYNIIKLCLKKIRFIDKYIILGIFIMLLYGQVQNIGMTIGLLPITGIPLPFISYGGTSLISYLFIIGIILKINKDYTKYRN